MVRRLKWIGYFILVLFVVLSGLVVSPKATAIDLTQNVSYLGYLDTSYRQAVIDSGTCTSSGEYINNTTDIACSSRWYLTSASQTGFNSDYIFGFTFFIYEYRDREDLHSYINSNGNMNILNGSTRVAYGSYIGFETNNISNSSTQITMYYKMNSSGTIYPGYRFELGNPVGLQSRELMSVGSAIAVLSLANYNVTVNTNNTDLINAIVDLKNSNASWQQTINTNLQNLIQNINNNQSTIQNIDNSVQNIENNFDNQQQQAELDGQQSQDDSNQSGQDVEASTTNILSAITGFFGAFTSATATTCQTDWGIEGFRNFDFCGTQIPTSLRVVFTIVASIIFIPMIWFLINSILSAFKEFQQ